MLRIFTVHYILLQYFDGKHDKHKIDVNINMRYTIYI